MQKANCRTRRRRSLSGRGMIDSMLPIPRYQAQSDAGAAAVSAGGFS